MANLCIIPARGGSKRIPRKNIKNFLGKPIIAYSIEAALQSKLFDEVMVSTDDPEIAEVAIQYGAKVPFMRSAENSNDFATTFDVIEEVLYQYRKVGEIFENCCCIYPCAPFVTSATLKKAFDLLINEHFASVIPVVEMSIPIERSLTMKEEKISFRFPEHALTRSQDLSISYQDAGQIYWMNVEQILQQQKVITPNTGAIIISTLEAQDIDNEMDWKLAELKYQLCKS